ncbi:MAG: hypothetical protein E7Y34_02665 [Mycoplasma sp.]|nr:hypothetical protein [Mycoplasma sp.]
MKNTDIKDKLLYGEFNQHALLHIHENRKTNKSSCLVRLSPDTSCFFQDTMVFPNDSGFVVGISPKYSYKLRKYKDKDNYDEIVMSGIMLYETYIKNRFEVKKQSPYEKLKKKYLESRVK